jgi:hypothetical protein
MARSPQPNGFYNANYVRFLVNSFNSILYLIRHCPLSHIGPNILRSIFLSKINIFLTSFFVLVQVSVAYVIIGYTSILYIRTSLFLEIMCDLNCIFSPKYDLLAAIRLFVISSETLLSPFNNESRYA